MHKILFSKPSSYQLYRSIRSVLAIGLVCLFLLGVVGNTKTSYADGGPGGNVSDPVVRAVDIAQPAVVRILTTLNGHVIVHFPLASGKTQDVTFPQNTQGYPLELSGTGTFISAHGDILTADHVINPPHDQSLSSFLDDQAAQDIATYIAQHSSSQPSPSQVAAQLKSGQLPSDVMYDPASSEVFLSSDYTGPLTVTSMGTVPANIHATVDRIEKQSSFDQADVAIIHVPMNDMPSVLLGDSSKVQRQDNLTIIGFPGNADVNTANPTDFLTSSVNKIFVSSLKTTQSGAPLIQVGGNVEHGDSGGPALDNQGQIVGIVSFGLATDTPGATSFLQASNSAQALVQSLNLDTTPGAFQKAWSQAFADYASTTAGHWHTTQQEFQVLANGYSLFKAIQPYLTYAQAQARTESTTQGPSTSPGSATQGGGTSSIWLILGGVVLILGALVLFVAVQRGRSKRTSAAPALVQSQSQPAQMPAPPSSMAQSGSGNYSFPQQYGPRSGPEQGAGMAAFGAPPSSRMPPMGQMPSPSGPNGSASTLPTMPTVNSGILRPWPCGHMNRSNARYCSICGEPAPPGPPYGNYEQ